MTKFSSSFSRQVREPREEFNTHIPVLEKMGSQAERIRYLIKEFPDAKDREISDFLELNRPQWVWNVRHQIEKRKIKEQKSK